MTTFQLLLIVFSFGRTKDSRIFDDQFEHIHSQSAQDVSSLMKTHPGPTINLHIEDRIEILHSLTLENRHIVITGLDSEKSALTATSTSDQHLFRQINSTLQLHSLFISLTGPSTILSNLHSSSLFIAQTIIETLGTNNLVTSYPSQTDGLSSSVSVIFTEVRILTQSGVIHSFVGVCGQEDSHQDTDFDLSITVLSQSLHSVKLTPQCGIFVSSPAPTACSFDACTSVSSSGCRFTNISSVPNASPNMPPHFRTHYKQLLSSMDMAHSEHGLYGLVSSDINSGGDFLFKNTSFSHCTTTETGQAYDQDHPCTDGSVTTFDSCTFTSMTSTSPGAGLWRQNAVSLTLISCTFTECVSTVAQGHHGGGLCAYNCDTVNLEGTNKFDRCVCKGGAGGGYFISETTTTLVVSGVKCEDCSNSDGSGYYGNGGGGFLGMNKAPEAAVQITNCEFTGCTSTSTGGLTVNIAWTVVSSCKFTDCEGNGHERGGGLNFYPTGTHTLSFSSFTNCSHLTGIGGGVAFAGKSTITMDSVDFVDCHTDNGQGGGCWANGVVVLESVTFTNCYALNGEGGGCYLGNGSSVEVKDCSFTDCNITLDSYATGGGALAGT